MMEAAFNNLKIIIFDLVGYLLPGSIAVALWMMLFTDSGLINFEKYLVYLLVLSYLIGIFIHSLLNNYTLKQLLWKLYHHLKEKGKDGKGVTDPKTKKGKFAKWIRKTLLEASTTGDKTSIPTRLNSISTQIITKHEGNSMITPFEISYLKECYFTQSSKLSEDYSHLNYQKTLSAALGIVFQLYGIAILISQLWLNIRLNISNDIYLDFYGASIVFGLGFLLIGSLFDERSEFFKNYKNGIVSAYIILNYKEGFENV